jgi:NADPH:quinone reductase-like Zn-dependent oxidoreductase
MRAIHLSAYGNPIDGLGMADVPEPKAPGVNEVLVAIEYSPINPNDLLVAQGAYPLRPELPSVIGNEGVGRVLAVGPGVTNVAVGDRIAPRRSSWVWRERMVVPAAGLFALPLGADPKQLAMLTINPPTASLLLSDYVNLNRGDVVVQNAANSGVGRWVIAFAKRRGLRTVNIVRRAELVPDLQAAGGDVVVVDGPEVIQEIKKAVGSDRIRLALDGVSGPATGVLASVLVSDSELREDGTSVDVSAGLHRCGHDHCRDRSPDVRDPHRVADFDPTHGCGSRRREGLPIVLRSIGHGRNTGRPSTHPHTAVASNTRCAKPSVHSVGTNSPRPTRSRERAAAPHDTPAVVVGVGRW